jgi:lipopolysaccharide export system permease protein
VGIGISLLSFFANDVLLPAGQVQFTRLYRQILVSTPALELEANSVKRFKDTVVITGNVFGNSIDDVLILDKTSDGERRVIMAKRAELRDAGKEGLSLDLDNAFIQSSKEIARQDYDYASSGFLRYWVPQEDMIQAISSVSPREMSSLDVWLEIQRMQRELQNRLDERYGRALNQILPLESSLRKGPARGEWNRRESLTANLAQELRIIADYKKDWSLLSYRLEYYKKFSIPFGALAFVFLAVPLGFFAKKSGQTLGFMVGLLIAVVYWALLFVGQTMGLRLGYSPFWSMWLPNILTFSVGFCLCLARIRR